MIVSCSTAALMPWAAPFKAWMSCSCCSVMARSRLVCVRAVEQVDLVMVQRYPFRWRDGLVYSVAESAQPVL